MEKPALLVAPAHKIIPVADHDAMLVWLLYLHIIQCFLFGAEPYAGGIAAIGQKAVAAVFGS